MVLSAEVREFERRVVEPEPELIALLREQADTRGSAKIIGGSPDHTTVVRAEVQRGSIVYVAVAGGPYLCDRIVEYCDVTRRELAEVVQRCKVTGLRFGEQLLQDRRVTPAELQQAMRRHNRDQIRRAVRLETELAWYVLEQPHTFGEMFTFPLDDVWTADGFDR